MIEREDNHSCIRVVQGSKEVTSRHIGSHLPGNFMGVSNEKRF